MKRNTFAIILAILAALFYALSIPISKLLIVEIPPTALAGFLYLGAGIGMALVYLIRKPFVKKEKEIPLDKKDTKYVVGMVALDIAAPILLMFGISMSDASSASLLNNFEIVATAFIALLFFKEKISLKLWIGIGLISIASTLLVLDIENGFTFNLGSFLVLMACVCWGLENNCTRAISSKNPFHIVIIKGLCSGLGALVIALIIGQKVTNYLYVVYALLLGFATYGLSIFVYILAQRHLGAGKTSVYYSLAPFIGVGLSLLILHEKPNYLFYIALSIMVVALLLVSLDKYEIKDSL